MSYETWIDAVGNFILIATNYDLRYEDLPNEYDLGEAFAEGKTPKAAAKAALRAVGYPV